jgi:hypothetical protein
MEKKWIVGEKSQVRKGKYMEVPNEADFLTLTFSEDVCRPAEL